MAPANEKEPAGTRVVYNFRSIAYGVWFFLLFAMTASLLGLVSQQLHKYGDSYDHYASMEYKHGLGVLLFACLASLLVCLGHFWVGVGFISVWAITIAVFFGTGAGIMFQTTPFKGTRCNTPTDQWPVAWQPYAGECSRIVAIQGLAWALWGAYIFLFIGTLAHKFSIKAKPTPERWYHNA